MARRTIKECLTGFFFDNSEEGTFEDTPDTKWQENKKPEQPPVDVFAPTSDASSPRKLNSYSTASRFDEATTYPMPKMVVIHLKEHQDAAKICAIIQKGNICLVNAMETDVDVAKRVADVISGVSLALHAQIEEVGVKGASTMYLVAPRHVKITTDFKEAIYSNSDFHKAKTVGR